jgi:folate-dependent phosphoribosylglycinamide formyltransferase PurN
VNSIDHHHLPFQGITCLCVDVPDCEVIQCSPKNHVGTLLPEEKSKTGKRDFDVEALTKFLRQHDFDVKPEMVRLPLIL